MLSREELGHLAYTVCNPGTPSWFWEKFTERTKEQYRQVGEQLYNAGRKAEMMEAIKLICMDCRRGIPLDADKDHVSETDIRPCKAGVLWQKYEGSTRVELLEIDKE